MLTSDLSRAIETGKIVAGNLKIPAFRDPRLREAHLGEAEGMKYDAIQKKFGNETAARWRSYKKEDFSIGYPGGENGFQVANRVFAALTDFCEREAFEKFAVATHGGVIRRVIHTLIDHAPVEVPIPNLITYVIQYHSQTKKFHFQGWTPYSTTLES